MFIVFPRFRLRISVFALPIMMIMLWLEGMTPFLMIMLSALVHECGHLAALRAFGYRARRVDLLPMGALIVCPEGIANKREAVIALSGPAASLVCACICLIWFFIDKTALPLFACAMNTLLFAFNILPLGATDGSKALYCFLAEKRDEKTAERVCSAASVISKLMFCVFLSACIAMSGYNLGVILLSVALLIQIL